jgi:hypothetical protein
MRKAYPVYEAGYLDALAVMKKYLSVIENLQLIGRNGMHRYNNQDHSMLTAMLAVRNLFGANYDLWKVNSDDDYHEEHELAEQGAGDELYGRIREMAETQPLVPSQIVARDV